MCPRDVVSKYNLTVRGSFNGGAVSSFDIKLNVPFTPDAVRILSASYCDDLAETGLLIVHSSIAFAPDGLFGIRDGGDKSFEGVEFNTSVSQGTQTIEARNVSGALDVGRNGDLCMELQFVKYSP